MALVQDHVHDCGRADTKYVLDLMGVATDYNTLMVFHYIEGYEKIHWMEHLYLYNYEQDLILLHYYERSNHVLNELQRHSVSEVSVVIVVVDPT